jgi:hypothetical protein
MSSQLSTYVPVLTGPNYQEWAAKMQAYLMSQGQWKCIRDSAPEPEKSVTEEITQGEGSDEGKTLSRKTTVIDNAEEMKNWYESCDRAMGNIRLRLSSNISSQYLEATDPLLLWHSLKDKYGKPGISTAFVEFKGAMDTFIPNNQDPTPSIDKILTHFVRLSSIDFEIPEKIKAMIILAKAPKSMETAVQMIASEAYDKAETSNPIIRNHHSPRRRAAEPAASQQAQRG